MGGQWLITANLLIFCRLLQKTRFSWDFSGPDLFRRAPNGIFPDRFCAGEPRKNARRRGFGEIHLIRRLFRRVFAPTRSSRDRFGVGLRWRASDGSRQEFVFARTVHPGVGWSAEALAQARSEKVCAPHLIRPAATFSPERRRTGHGPAGVWRSKGVQMRNVERV